MESSLDTDHIFRSLKRKSTLNIGKYGDVHVYNIGLMSSAVAVSLKLKIDRLGKIYAHISTTTLLKTKSKRLQRSMK